MLSVAAQQGIKTRGETLHGFMQDKATADVDRDDEDEGEQG